MKKFLIDLLVNIISEVAIEALNRLTDWIITYPWQAFLS
jgi:hypothetical protein